MSNYLFSGYEFSSELKADFKLQNLLQAQVGEEQQMSLKLLNRQSEGFLIGTKTPYGATPQFVLDQITGGVTQNLITLDSNTGQLGLNFNIDLGNTYKIQNSIDPTDDGDLTNKLWVENLARVRTIDLTTGTNGLSITKNTDIENPVFNIDLSIPLQNFSDLSTNGLVHKIGADNFNTFAAGVDGQVLVTTANTFAWTDLARVTSIGLTTNTSSLSISGGPVIDSGDINIDVSSSLQNLSNLAGTGLIKQTGVDTFTNFAAPVADNQVIVSSGGDFITTNFTRVTSIGLTSASTGLSITNTPITDNGNINVDLSSRLENISNLSSLGIVVKDDVDTFSTAPVGSAGQFLGVSGTGQLEWQNTGTVNSVGMTTSSGLSVTGTPITSNGTFDLTLDASLQNLAGLSANGILIKSGSSYATSVIPTDSGRILQSNNGVLEWVSQAGGGNVNGASSTTQYAIATWGNTAGNLLNNTPLSIDTSGNLNMNNRYIINLPTPFTNDHGANKGYVDYSTQYLKNNEINVNVDGGMTNWIRRSPSTRTGVQIYGMSSNSMVIENTSGESAGIAVNGSTDQCTIWTAGDSGSLLNIQDEDSTDSRVAYVNNIGAWIQVSSKLRKHSIKEKSNNEVLDRMMQLSVKSFGYKYDNNKSAEKTIKRITKKQNAMRVGLIMEEVFKLFPNCIGNYYNPLHKEKRDRKKLTIENEVKDVSNTGIDHNTLLCYLVMAFQEFVTNTNNEILNLKKVK
tara:strand:- start:5896 stop:8115 length:2220 start_codon:yes stop_codon:yes gene_type:complete